MAQINRGVFESLATSSTENQPLITRVIPKPSILSDCAFNVRLFGKMTMNPLEALADLKTIDLSR